MPLEPAELTEKGADLAAIPGPVVAFAGRRVDPPADSVPAGGAAGAERFPAANAARVGAEIERILHALGARWLVSAAACGADILALEAAARLGLRRRVVLPATVADFRRSSVVDRPGDWGERYDRIIAAVAAAGELLPGASVAVEREAGRPASPGDALDRYLAANLAILDEAARIASREGRLVQALVAWNGLSRGAGDVTAHFLAEARRRRLLVTEISTRLR